MTTRTQPRVSRYVRVAQLAYALTAKVLPRHWHKKSPQTYTVPQLAACVLLMSYLGRSYRDLEEWLLASDRVCQALELTSVPDHTTLYRAFRRLRLGDLDRLRQTFLDQAKVTEEVVAVDTTGLRTTQASAYFEDRRGRPRREFVKPGYAVGTESQYILAWNCGVGPGSDLPFWPGLRRAARRYAARTAEGKVAWTLLGDKGFYHGRLQRNEIVPPLRKGHWQTRPRYHELEERVAAARLAGVFGQRWKCETVNSVIKRKMGDTIRARKPTHQRRESALKALAYNLHVCSPIHLCN